MCSRALLLCLAAVLGCGLLVSVARADVAVASTPAGREAKVVTLFYTAEAIVHGTVASKDAQTGHYQFTVNTAIKPATGLPQTLTIAEAKLPIINQVGQKTGETPVPLGVGKQYLLFLVRAGKDGLWKLPPDSLWDGFHVGNPADYGFLLCGGVETPDLKKSPTYQTVAALMKAPGDDRAARIPGLRILFRASARSGGHRSGWDVCQKAFAELEPAQQQAVIAAVLAEPLMLENYLVWDLVRMAVAAKATDLAPWAARQMTETDPRRAKGAVVAAVLAARLGEGDTRKAACQRLAEIYLNDRPERPEEIVVALAAAADPDVEKTMRRHLVAGGKNDLQHKALQYFKHSKSLGPADVKTLVPMIHARGPSGMDAADVLEPIVGKSFRIPGGGRAPLAESKKWQDWWQNEGSKDPRFQ